MLPLGDVYHRAPARSAIHFWVAWDLASVARLVMCDMLVSRKYAGPSSGGLPSAAAFAQVSAASLPSTAWCAGVYRMVIILLRLVILPPTSRMAMARRCPGPMLSEWVRSASDAESENMVNWRPLFSLWLMTFKMVVCVCV